MSLTCHSNNILIICLPEFFLECSQQNFLRYELFSPIFGQVRTDRQTDGQTESDAYEPNVQYAQVGSITKRAIDGVSAFT